METDQRRSRFSMVTLALCYCHWWCLAVSQYGPVLYFSPSSQSCTRASWLSWHICLFAKGKNLRKPTITFILIKNSLYKFIVHHVLIVTGLVCCLSLHLLLLELQTTAYCDSFHSA